MIKVNCWTPQELNYTFSHFLQGQVQNRFYIYPYKAHGITKDNVGKNSFFMHLGMYPELLFCVKTNSLYLLVLFYIPKCL